MMERIAGASPSPRARITGAVYLLYFLTAVFAEVVVGKGRLVAYDAANLVADAFYIAVTLLFYFMFKPVNRSLSLLAALFSLLGCAVAVLGLFRLAPYKISPLIFFGPFCILLGYLILRSTFLPRFIGALMVLAGVGWLTYLFPFASHLSNYLKILGIVAEGSLMLWLIVMGVNDSKWDEKASPRLPRRAPRPFQVS
ncbi:MAG: DUF4386 domain-containing protein [Candidatus Acidiferrales bacterium]